MDVQARLDPNTIRDRPGDGYFTWREESYKTASFHTNNGDYHLTMSAMVSSFPPPYQEDFRDTPPPRYGDANSIITSKSEEEQCSLETSEEVQVNLIDNNNSTPYSVGDLILADLVILPKEDLHVTKLWWLFHW